jgi:methionyl-tRNA synthetase
VGANIVHNSQQIFNKKIMPENIIAFVSTHQWVIAIAAVWTLSWKGVALWRAARNQSVAWFVILLIVNTLGILEIIYILFFSREKHQSSDLQKENVRKNKKVVLDIKSDKTQS